MFPAEVLGSVFGLVAAASWGTSDFSGGVASKRSPLFSVVIASQAIGFVLLLLLGIAFGEDLPGLRNAIWAAFAGLAGLAGLLALYQGLAVGRMGVVAPVSAVISGVMPVVVSIFVDGVPHITRLIGFVLALVSVWLVSQSGDGRNITLKELRLPLIAGLAFGLFFIFIDRVTTDAVFLPLAIARVASLTVMLILAAVLGWQRIPTTASTLFVLLSGVFDASGNIFFALSAQVGTLAIAVVISGLYPAGTVLLARVFLQEKIGVTQWVGIVLALAAITLIAI